MLPLVASVDTRPAAAAAERAGYAAIWTSGDLTGFQVCGSPLVVTGSTDEGMAAARRGVREQIAFYGSTPAYRPVLDLHGWGELSDELHTLSLDGRWTEMGEAISDDVLHAFAVVAEPDQVAPELLRRYGDLMTRMILYTPYQIDAAVLATIAAGLRAAGTSAAAGAA